MVERKAPPQPLAAALRPKSLDEFVGQQHILGAGQPLRVAIESGQLHSMIFWGPPGVGKTTLAHLIAESSDCELEHLSAVLSGVKDIRAAVERAQQRRQINDTGSILFVDEVHRFNKSQQDAFLPFVEDGTITFVGATTENPSFELNNALLSRSSLYVLKPLLAGDLAQVVERALAGQQDKVVFADELRERLINAANGDARRLLNLLELLFQLLDRNSAANAVITEQQLELVLQGSWRKFDKGGDGFYEQISALHKAVRGSSPDASLYWFSRMIDGGCDPMYIGRRMLRMASEDIGNADPRALALVVDAVHTYERLGSPEGELAIAQALIYLACAPKSNAVYMAYKAAAANVSSAPDYEVPEHLRNAPTRLHKELGYGAEYRYAHDETGAFAAGENYFPEALGKQRYYLPNERGLEIKIAAKLRSLEEQNLLSVQQRYPDGASSEGDA